MKRPNPSIPNPNIQPNQVYSNKEIYKGNDLTIGNYKQSRGPIRDKIGPYNAPTSSGDVIRQVAQKNALDSATQPDYVNSIAPINGKMTEEDLNATTMRGFRLYPPNVSETGSITKTSGSGIKKQPHIKTAAKGIKSYSVGSQGIYDNNFAQEEIGKPIKQPRVQNEGNLAIQQQIIQQNALGKEQLNQSIMDSVSGIAGALGSKIGGMKKPKTSAATYNGGNNMAGEPAPDGIQATAADGIKNFKQPKYLENYQAVSTNPIPDYIYGEKSLKGYDKGTRVIKYPGGSKSVKSTKNWTPEVKIMDNPYPKETQEPEKYSKKEQLEGDAIAKVLMGRNKGKNFVDRAFNSQNYPSRQTNTIPGFEGVHPDEYSTHLMATGESRNGKTPIYPTLEYNKSTDKLDDVWGKEPKEYIEAPDMYAKYIGEFGYKTATGLGIRPNDARQSLSGFEKTKSIPMEEKGSSGIHIKPENRGKFTEYKKRTGKTTEEALHSEDPHVRKMANFAKNASKWKH